MSFFRQRRCASPSEELEMAGRRRHDVLTWEVKRKDALHAFEDARRRMLAKPFPLQFSAYHASAAALVGYLDLEELAQEAQLADRRRQQYEQIRSDIAAAERKVRDLFDEAYRQARTPYEPQARNRAPLTRRRPRPSCTPAMAAAALPVLWRSSGQM
ncbi:hypothetical protein JCM10908_003697 [Rhodotorula pacifica]|uniref:uncharacterized protein n=1 Tax=Rhodotorula pacifica TaxID=1495444 RepID=UPI00316C0BB9